MRVISSGKWIMKASTKVNTFTFVWDNKSDKLKREKKPFMLLGKTFS